MGEEGWEGARSDGGCEGRWRSEGAGFPPSPHSPSYKQDVCRTLAEHLPMFATTLTGDVPCLAWVVSNFGTQFTINGTKVRRDLANDQRDRQNDMSSDARLKYAGGSCTNAAEICRGVK